MKWCLAVACGFVSLCASLPTYAGDGPAPKPSATASSDDALSERVAALVQPKSKHDAPAETGATKPAPKKSSDDAAPAADKKKPAAKTGKRSKKKGKGKKKKDAGSAEGRKISLEEDFLVEGKLEKPNAYYILRRSQSGYDWARLDAKFLPLVLESVQDPLF
jgi:hypothetical protein